MVIIVLQSAWHNAPQLQCFGNGQNVVPTIHIKDLAAWVTYHLFITTCTDVHFGGLVENHTEVSSSYEMIIVNRMRVLTVENQSKMVLFVLD